MARNPVDPDQTSVLPPNRWELVRQQHPDGCSTPGREEENVHHVHPKSLTACLGGDALRFRVRGRPGTRPGTSRGGGDPGGRQRGASGGRRRNDLHQLFNVMLVSADTLPLLDFS